MTFNILVGLYMFGVSKLLLTLVLWGWVTDKTITGCSSIITIIMLFGSVEALLQSVVSDYVGKIYSNKNR